MLLNTMEALELMITSPRLTRTVANPLAPLRNVRSTELELRSRVTDPGFPPGSRTNWEVLPGNRQTRVDPPPAPARSGRCGESWGAPAVGLLPITLPAIAAMAAATAKVGPARKINVPGAITFTSGISRNIDNNAAARLNGGIAAKGEIHG